MNAMPLLRPSIALRASRILAATPSSSSILSGTSGSAISSHIRTLSATTKLAASDHVHEDHYDPPTGWLFGVKPGEKYQKEGWEGVWMWGFFGSLGLAVVAYAFKPDTSYVPLFTPFLFFFLLPARET
jgi:hypothetical protein